MSLVSIPVLRRPVPAFRTPTGRIDKYIHVTAKDSDSDSCTETGVGYIDVCTGTAVGGASNANGIRPNTILPTVPDLNGMRFCRVCHDFIPVSCFPRGPRRFTCRVHLWQRTGQKAKKALLMKPRKRLLARMWMQGYKDCFKFGHTRITLTQKELDALIDAYADRVCDGGCGNGHAGCDKGDTESLTAAAVERLDELAVVPINSAKMLCTDNAMVVTKEKRRELLVAACRRGL